MNALEATVLLVEDNPDDEALTLRALRRFHLANDVVVVRDGAEALDFLHATGAYAGRTRRVLPQLVLLDLNLPKIDGLQVLRRLRADPRTKLLPVALLTSSDEERDRILVDVPEATSFMRKPVEFGRLAEAVRQLGLSWLVQRPR